MQGPREKTASKSPGKTSPVHSPDAQLPGPWAGGRRSCGYSHLAQQGFAVVA